MLFAISIESQIVESFDYCCLMRWQIIKNLQEEQFKRLVGVKPAIFEKRVSEAKRINKTEVQKITGKKRGPNQLVR